MQTVRTYHVRSCWVWCHVDFVPEDADWEKDPDICAALERYSISMRAQVLYRKPSSDREMPDRFHVRAHSNIPRKYVLDEAMRFLQTLNTMYDL